MVGFKISRIFRNPLRSCLWYQTSCCSCDAAVMWYLVILLSNVSIDGLVQHNANFAIARLLPQSLNRYLIRNPKCIIHHYKILFSTYHSSSFGSCSGVGKRDRDDRLIMMMINNMKWWWYILYVHAHCFLMIIWWWWWWRPWRQQRRCWWWLFYEMCFSFLKQGLEANFTIIFHHNSSVIKTLIMVSFNGNKQRQ